MHLNFPLFILLLSFRQRKFSMSLNESPISAIRYSSVKDLDSVQVNTVSKFAKHETQCHSLPLQQQPNKREPLLRNRHPVARRSIGYRTSILTMKWIESSYHKLPYKSPTNMDFIHMSNNTAIYACILNWRQFVKRQIWPRNVRCLPTD